MYYRNVIDCNKYGNDSLTKCINIVLEAEKKLNEANGDIATIISGKLNRVLSKNKGRKQLLDVINVLCGSVI